MNTLTHASCHTRKLAAACIAGFLASSAGALHAAEYRAISLTAPDMSTMLGFSGASFSDGLAAPAAIILSSIENTSGISNNPEHPRGRPADSRIVARFGGAPRVNTTDRTIDLSTFGVYQQEAIFRPADGAFRVLCDWMGNLGECLNDQPDLAGNDVPSPVFPAGSFSGPGASYEMVWGQYFRDLRGAVPVTYYCSGPCFHFGTTTVFSDRGGGSLILFGAASAVPYAVNPDGSLTARFTADYAPDAGMYAFNFAPVPEPRTYALFLGGLAAVFGMVRRSRRARSSM